MTVLGEFSREFMPSVMFVGDEYTEDEIPDWTAPTDMVTASPSGLLLRVQHAVDGPVDVRVLTDPAEARYQCRFEGSIRVESGSLMLSDVSVTEPYRIALRAGVWRVRVFADDWANASAVDVVMDHVEEWPQHSGGQR